MPEHNRGLGLICRRRVNLPARLAVNKHRQVNQPGAQWGLAILTRHIQKCFAVSTKPGIFCLPSVQRADNGLLPWLQLKRLARLGTLNQLELFKKSACDIGRTLIKHESIRIAVRIIARQMFILQLAPA